MTEREILKVADAAEITGFSVYTIRRAIHEGDLIASKMRGEYRIWSDDLVAWIDEARVNVPRATGDGGSANMPTTPRPTRGAPPGSARAAIRASRKRAA